MRDILQIFENVLFLKQISGNGVDQIDTTATLESNPSSNQSAANQTADLIELYKQVARFFFN